MSRINENQMIPVDVLSISYHPTNKGYAVLLKEQNGERHLPIIVGEREAHSIAVTLEGRKLRRPLTHDLMIDTIEAIGGKITKVSISDLREGTFYAQIFIQNPYKDELVFDSRPSDAISLSLRTVVPIFVSESILQNASLENMAREFHYEVPDNVDDGNFSFTEILTNLKTAMEQAVEEENYETAAKLRNRIKQLEC
ncbi:MAG: bifunctional nuclease family protein [Candidatus Marinimicrobia bacterium]|nr:bifunctional nuclease family protein [Candidatus Neomarinimicrobiota bacterium]MBL7023429.1 bifunctional nuclease family protein [Candidatus Neomarinimicrobiota bacterium]MBL7108822.1 bifunctional nuclease family protein [Candidatus Neomarinimicrobiota bacterium]